MLKGSTSITQTVNESVSWTWVLVKFAATCIVFLYLFILIMVLALSPFPHKGGMVTGLMVCVTFPLVGIGVWKITFALIRWPWYDTLVVLVWLAWQAFWNRGNPWPSWNDTPTTILVFCAVLRWIPYLPQYKSAKNGSEK